MGLGRLERGRGKLNEFTVLASDDPQEMGDVADLATTD